MANQKITDMTAATVAGPTDVFPIVQGGVNKKQTRPVFLTAQAGDVIEIKQGGTTIGINASGDVFIQIASGKVLQILSAGLAGFTIDTGENVYVAANTGETVQILQGGLSSVQLGDTSVVVTHNSNRLELDSTNGVNLQADSGKKFAVASTDGSALYYDAAGNLSLRGHAGITVTVGSDTDYVTFLSGGGIAFNLTAGVAIAIPYQTPTASDWLTSPPGTYEDALNRMSALLFANFGAIP